MRVTSSNVAAIVKDGDDLCVRFNSGKCYRYTGAGDLYYDMLAADSKGVFLNTEVKPHYLVEMMDDEKFEELETMSGAEVLAFRFTGGKGCYF